MIELLHFLGGITVMFGFGAIVVAWAWIVMQ
jgi:hypothetical protein